MRSSLVILCAFILSVHAAVAGDYVRYTSPRAETEIRNPVKKRPYTHDDSVSIATIRARMDSIRAYRPTVAVVLCGGGAKGAAHVGVFKYLEQIELPVDMVLGTSMGGLLGGLYALGYNADQLDSILRSMDWNYILRDQVSREYVSYSETKYREKYLLRIPFYYAKSNMAGEGEEMEIDFENSISVKFDWGADDESGNDVVSNLSRSLPSGLVKGQNVFNVISGLSVGYQDSLAFCDLPIPFACVVTDLVNGDGKYCHSGKFNTALRATMSIPAIFSPIKMDDMVLVDGGLRDNFPVAEARLLGADIVIGVDLGGEQKTSDQINNLGDVLWQWSDMLGKPAYDYCLGLLDLRIKPDLKEYNMMSFDARSIDTIINRGMAAALAHADTLAYFKSLTGDAHTELKHKRAVDLSNHPVTIKSIEFRGVSGKDSEILRKLAKVRDTHVDTVSRTDIETVVATIYGTRAFEYVTYELEGQGEPYTLVFTCKRGPVHRFGLGLRADTEEIVDVMVNLGLNAYDLYGSKLNISGKIGSSPGMEVAYSFSGLKLPIFNVSADVKWMNLDMLSELGLGGLSNMGLKYFSTTQKAYLSNISWALFDLQGGLKNRYFRVRSISNELSSSLYVEDLDYKQFNNDYLSLFLNARADTFDDGYFPSRGFTLGAEYEWVFKGCPDNISDFHVVSADVKGVVRAGRIFAWLPSAAIRFVFGNDSSFVLHENYVGGSIPGRYFDQQIPFMGINNVVPMNDILAVLRSDFRFEAGSHNYITAIFNYARDCDDIGYFFDSSARNRYGAAIEYAYDSFLGPIKADLHWSNINKDKNGGVGFYLSLGYNF